jgi:choline dehydrogenase-like flavoprotein
VLQDSIACRTIISTVCLADVSVVPTIVSGNTDATAIMIEKKAADMIREPAPAVMPKQR